MRLTIERLRALLLTAAALLLVALVGFLAVAKLRNPLSRKDLPQKLAGNIQQEANGWTYSHERNGRTLYKIHAARLEQMTADNGGRVLLHDVKIELYGEDGNRQDRIEGAEFEYDQKQGRASAPGPVEIIITRPGAPLAIAPNAAPEKAIDEGKKSKTLAAAAQAISAGKIRIKTSGLLFDQKSGIASTHERVAFLLANGGGGAQGAAYDSGKGQLELLHTVEIHTTRGEAPVVLHADHATFERGDLLCHLHSATMESRGGKIAAGNARILFREDGSVVRLDAQNNVAMETAAGAHLTAPTGFLEFDARNQPSKGRLLGGVVLDSLAHSAASKTTRQIHGSAPQADLLFTGRGLLRQAHLERGVELRSEEQNPTQGRLTHTWRSAAADLDFRATGRGRLAIVSIHGIDGVQVASEGSTAKQPARFTADDAVGRFGADAQLLSLTGAGHAVFEQTTASGARQRTSGDRIDVRFQQTGGNKLSANHEQIESATVDGNVVLLQEPRASSGQPAAPLRATAGHAQYDSTGAWIHLTIKPRVRDGALELSAERIDFAQASGDAFARGNVKAAWSSARDAAKAPATPTLGGSGPIHAIAAEAQLHRDAAANRQELQFRSHARLWQGANSIEAPEILLDRAASTLKAKSASPAEPVRAVFLNASAPAAGPQTGGSAAAVIRLRGGELTYSDADRRGRMLGSPTAQTTAETATGRIASNEIELVLAPQGAAAGQAQVERMTARGRVTITSQGRTGSGERLDYKGQSGEYILTGTPAAPPKAIDPARGEVTGERLIFQSSDNSVTVEGGAHKTRTETQTPR